MEGKSLPAIVLLLLFGAQANAQWRSDPSLFLEPNRFTVAKELDSRALWLAAGFGSEFARVGAVGIGMEGFIWSRLRALPDFRFPVETADFFFGLEATRTQESHAWRFRISHISSHVVDGADSTVVGGSSSRFSREFVEIDRQQYFFYDRLRLSAGLRYLFHQVQPIEPSFAVPVAFTWRVSDFGSIENVQNHPRGRTPAALEVFVTTGDGPSWPNYGAGVRLTHALMDVSRTDLELLYQWGSPWAGTEANRRQSSIKVQLSLTQF